MAFAVLEMPPSVEPDLPADLSSDGLKIWELFGRLWDENCACDPIGATAIGDYRFNSGLASLSKAALEGHIQALKDIQSEATAIDDNGLIEADRTNLDYLKEMLSIEIDALAKLRLYEFPTQHMFGPHLLIVQAANFHPWRDLADCTSFFARISQFGRQVDEMIDAFREGIRTGRTLPTGSVAAIIPQTEAQIVDDPTQSPLYQLAAKHVESVRGDVNELLRITQDIIVPAFQKLSTFLKDEYEPHARKDAGLWSMPGGDDAYRAAIHFYTSLELDPQEVHDLGLKEIARIQAEIEQVREKLHDTDGTLTEFARRMESDPKYLLGNGEQIIDKYKELLERAKVQTLHFFDKLPEAQLDVKAVEEFRQVASPAAHYYPAPADRSRPGVFYANTYKPETRPVFSMAAIALHEGIPGHHMQIALAQELNGLPRLRKECQEFTIGYAEGWGLYTEYLGEVMDFYTDPVTYYGRLLTEIWRAARLVVDTGLHYLKWSREDAIAYMQANTGLGENEATVEVDRYTVMPAQALSYKMGELTILRLKDYAQAELGDSFSWKAFHDVVLRDGALPLAVLEKRVQQWVEQTKSE